MARLSRSQVARLKGVLNMMYKPQEMANQLGLEVRTIYRSHIPAGAPVQRDEAGRIWIPGLAYRDWAREQLARKRAEKRTVGMNEAYCVRCNQVVEMVEAHRRKDVEKTGVGMISGRCPVCRGKVNRFFKISDGSMSDELSGREDR